MRDRPFFQALEASSFAPYAALSERSRGRRHPEDEHAFRTAFQRDRDRIIHSTAFRRLEYKTQVFVNHEGDHYRTRLTHTLEAAQIARTMARALRLNEDLTESVTLAHDLGHTPFGHAGEDAMNVLMKDHGGFEHNLQSLRTVEEIERRYPDFPGLNLTFEVREGILKHSSEPSKGPAELRDGRRPTLEAQLVDEADEIAYTNHDLEDGLSSGLLELEALKAIPLWKRHFSTCCETYPDATPKVKIRTTIRAILNELVTDLIAETERRIETAKIASLDDVRDSPDRLVRFTVQAAKAKLELKRFLFENLYRHYRVVRMSSKAKRVVTELFGAYSQDPRQLPPHVAARIEALGIERVVCDYIAGMTDRFALDEHRKLFDPHVRL